MRTDAAIVPALISHHGHRIACGERMCCGVARSGRQSRRGGGRQRQGCTAEGPPESRWEAAAAAAASVKAAQRRGRRSRDGRPPQLPPESGRTDPRRGDAMERGVGDGAGAAPRGRAGNRDGAAGAGVDDGSRRLISREANRLIRRPKVSRGTTMVRGRRGRSDVPSPSLIYQL
jgi:hypothetical protein